MDFQNALHILKPVFFCFCFSSSLMSTLGYGLLADTQSRAVSAMTLDVHSATPVEEEPDIGPTRSEVKLQLEKDKEEALNILREKYQAKMDSMETRYQ